MTRNRTSNERDDQFTIEKLAHDCLDVRFLRREGFFADGGLTIGDTHEYAEPFGFDLDEDAYDHLRTRAETLLGAPIPPVRRRWAGVYSEVDPTAAGHALYHRSEVEPGVVLVTGPGGRGMTCSPAIAEETFR